MAKKMKPLSLNFWYKASMEGISSLQGPHQVAQKLRKMTFPLKLLNSVFLAPIPSKTNSGAFFLSLTGWIFSFENRSSSPFAKRAVQKRAKKTAQQQENLLNP